MKLAVAAAQGEWFVWSEDKKTGEKVQFEIRRIPAEEAKRIEREVLGHKRQAKYKKGVQLIDYDVDESEEISYRKAAYALLNSRGGAELPADEIPAIASSAGATHVTLDGQWSPEVKRQAFQAFPSIATWVVEKAEQLDARAAEEEEGKGWTS